MYLLLSLHSSWNIWYPSSGNLSFVGKQLAELQTMSSLNSNFAISKLGLANIGGNQ